MGKYLFQAVPRIAEADLTSNSVESQSGPSDTPDTLPPPYTKPEKKEK